MHERLGGLELRRGAQQQILAAVGGDQLDADRQAGGVLVERDRARRLAVALNGDVNGANSPARMMPPSGSSGGDWNVPSGGGGSVTVGVSHRS